MFPQGEKKKYLQTDYNQKCKNRIIVKHNKIKTQCIYSHFGYSCNNYRVFTFLNRKCIGIVTYC